MADVCSDEEVKDNVSDHTESPTIQPPSPTEPATEEAPPEVKQEVEDPPPKVVRLDCEMADRMVTCTAASQFIALSFF